MKPNDIREILRNAGADLFQDRRNDPKARAQDALEGRTHYVDDSTLRYFHARILSSGCTCSDTLFYIVESAALNPDNRSRGFRGVVFDVFGTVVYRPCIDESYHTSVAARKAMYRWIDQFDLAGHYADVFKRRAARLARESIEADTAAQALAGVSVEA